MSEKYSVALVLFDGFETLDAFGPVEMLGMYPEVFQMKVVAETTASVTSSQGLRTEVDASFGELKQYDILLVPGGQGTRKEVENEVLLNWLKYQSANAKYISSVCTGSALLGKAGILKDAKATTNKMSFDWVTTLCPDVEWISHARWVEHGNIFTSSGVSAGMDMTLALIERILNRTSAEQAALWAEYSWHVDREHDPFARAWGLTKNS